MRDVGVRESYGKSARGFLYTFFGPFFCPHLLSSLLSCFPSDQEAVSRGKIRCRGSKIKYTRYFLCFVLAYHSVPILSSLQS